MRVQETWLWTALITPFTADGGRVDYPALAKLLERQEVAGNGVLLLGSTGEALSLSEDEKKEIVRFTCTQKLTVPVMVGVPNINLAQTLAWIDYCHGYAIDAYLAATPAYTKPNAAGQCGWFKKIFDAADAPIMLYNVPSRTGAALSTEVVKALSKHANFWAIKESSGGLDAYIDYVTAAPTIALYCGDDHLMPSAVPLGACGLVSVASNIWPEACRDYVTACRRGAYRGQEWWLASKSLFSAASPVPLKALMEHRSIIPYSVVRLPLSTSDLTGMKALEQADNAIEEWHRAYRSERERKKP
jgi:4-hydroxy-tetrahydrodipicolinate synthase